MTSPSSRTPTPLQDLKLIWMNPQANEKVSTKQLADSYTRLENLLSSPAVLALADHALRKAAEVVIAERKRQIEKEGWTPEHDDEHERGDLAYAAACYALNAGDQLHGGESQGDYSCLPCWPWDESWWKPKSYRRDLERAGALILAEIERINRYAAAQAAKGKGEGA